MMSFTAGKLSMAGIVLAVGTLTPKTSHAVCVDLPVADCGTYQVVSTICGGSFAPGMMGTASYFRVLSGNASAVLKRNSSESISTDERYVAKASFGEIHFRVMRLEGSPQVAYETFSKKEDVVSSTTSCRAN